MDYHTALNNLLSLTDLERMVTPATSRPRYDLRRMEHLLDLLGQPHLKVPSVHITGTKGKGSTAALLSSVLSAEGYTTGLYTSPHLHTIRERVRLDGTPIDEETFASLVEGLWLVIAGIRDQGTHGRVTTFEFLTTMAFRRFVEVGCDLQVLEVGLGGTLDATNVVKKPLVCLFTSISLDHTGVLGSTVEQIARDKAGIIKPGTVVVSAPQPPKVMAVLEEVCKEKGVRLVKVSEMYRWGRGSWNLNGQHFQVWTPHQEYQLWMPLLGGHQLENAACALAAAEALQQQGMPVSTEAVRKGFEAVRWHGRMELLNRSPLVVADGAHNPYSMEKLGEALRSYFSFEQLILIGGFSHGHDMEETAQVAAGWGPAVVFATRSRHPRSATTELVASIFRKHGLESIEVANVAAAYEQAMKVARPSDLVLVTGSLFVAAELREAILGIVPEMYPQLETFYLSQGVV